MGMSTEISLLYVSRRRVRIVITLLLLLLLLIFNIYINGNIKNIEEKLNNKVEMIRQYYSKKYEQEIILPLWCDIRINYSNLKKINEEKLNKKYNYEIYKYDSEHECKYKEDCKCNKKLEQQATHINAWIDGPVFNKEKYITIETVMPTKSEILGEINFYIEEIPKGKLATEKLKIEKLRKKEFFDHSRYNDFRYWLQKSYLTFREENIFPTVVVKEMKLLDLKKRERNKIFLPTSKIIKGFVDRKLIR